MTQQTCPMCGHAVRVYSGDEGTSSYEPVGCASLLSALERIALLDAATTGSGDSTYAVRKMVANVAREAIRVARGE